MVSQQEETFSISRKRLYLLWLLLVLILPFITFCFIMIATAGQSYPNLSIAPIFFTCMCFIWIGLSVEYSRQTTRVQIGEQQCTIKKFGQQPKPFHNNAILAYNERLDSGRGDTFNVLTVYLKKDYFILKSNEFDQYTLLRDYFTQYGQSVPYQKVLTLAERNRLRWLIGGLVLLIGANIAFAYLAHNPADKHLTQLTSVTDIVHQVREDRPKGTLHGVRISLQAYPAFDFYVSRKNYERRLDTLRWQINRQLPITIQIRASDYRKKLAKTEPLTFGDKYTDYNRIFVFGVDQGNHVHLRANVAAYEPTHTNPVQRTILLSFLLLLCWTGWVYVDQHKVLWAD